MFRISLQQAERQRVEISVNSCLVLSIEYSENEIITFFENEVWTWNAPVHLSTDKRLTRIPEKKGQY